MSTDSTPAIDITIHAELDGWPVDLALELAPARLGAALERLAALGYRPRTAAASQSPAAKPARPKATHYAPDGTPLCPIHNAPMREGQHGYYCARKAAEGEPANGKGYCSAVAD